MTKEEVDEVIKVAANAKAKWRETPINERAKILYKKGDEESFNKILSLLLSEIKTKVER